MQNYHTIIIGAGPAGLSCATNLAKEGRQVLVIDKKRRIGPKICAGGIPYHALQHLNIPEDLLELSFPTQHVFTPKQRTKITSQLPIISTINREKLGQLMVSRAAKAGATILPDTHVSKIGTNLIETSKGTYTFQNLVGADGSNSLVRRFLKIPSTAVGVGVQYLVPGKFSKMEWHFNPKKFGSGYAWIFPHKNSAYIGAYVERQEISAKLLKENLHEWAASHEISFKNCQPEAAIINFDFQGWHFGNIFLVGDAAGLASAITGEGMLPASISGVAAAKTILNPEHKDPDMIRLIRKHHRHRYMQKLLAGNKVICHLVLEMLVLGLKIKLIPFRSLEMA